MCLVFEWCRDLVVRLGKEIVGLEVNIFEGVFYLFFKCSSFFGKRYKDWVINNFIDLVMYLLEVGYVVVVSGDVFGVFGYFCISYVISDENIVEVMKRIKSVLEFLV